MLLNDGLNKRTLGATEGEAIQEIRDWKLRRDDGEREGWEMLLSNSQTASHCTHHL